MKILVVVRSLKQGVGISEWVSNYYSRMAQKDDLSIELLTEEGDRSVKSVKLSSKIKIITVHDMRKDPIKYMIDWWKISRNAESEYDYVHIHLDNFVRFFYLILLRKKKNIILHSHNSFNDKIKNSRVKWRMHKFGMFIVKNGNFIHFACSDLAANWLFGRKKYIQVNNGVDLANFEFNKVERKRYRDELDLNKCEVYGHIGRFEFQKNHERLIRIFSKIHAHNFKTKLLLIGTGPNMGEIKRLVSDLNLDEAVLFLGHRDDVGKILNAIDYIIFPSRYEGLPISLVEAQANGIPVFYSDTITKEIELLPSSQSFSLQENDDKIAYKICKGEPLIDRGSAVDVLKRKGYDREDVIEGLYKFYQNGYWPVQ
ncbi:glycosyltransferase [Loigolactobacillus bifermentans]|uniref:Glycosyltransferase n=1 Tax=Loigolactobacillus bifermentans DSM 20003 TaxID=1423726 RepID=A0A0R1H153_9LACO|nr:glycosyltransferase [Loigolactobacillus bifermentans]KRK40197.1 glycosyltransferase [Loigolactobacillus bifermentans DSM 20003]QGG61670.1 glycosyltransferase [Loigolactobacillus bifermentans]